MVVIFGFLNFVMTDAAAVKSDDHEENNLLNDKAVKRGNLGPHHLSRRAVNHRESMKHVQRRYFDSLGGGEIPLFERRSFDSLGGAELPLFDRRSLDSLGGAELPLYKRKSYNSYGGKEIFERDLGDSLDNDAVSINAGLRVPENKRYLDSLGGGEIPIFKKRNI